MIHANRNDHVLVNVERRGDSLREHIRDIVVGVGPVVKFCPKGSLPLLRLNNAASVGRVKHEAFKLQFADACDSRPRFESGVGIFAI